VVCLARQRQSLEARAEHPREERAMTIWRLTSRL
jgi:hypothetical protein